MLNASARNRHARPSSHLRRFSTDLQSDRSIDDQVALCRHRADNNGLAIVEAYADRARTGTSIFGRDGLLRLLEDAKAGRFQAIVVEHLDRLSRDQEDLSHIYKRMVHAGVPILSVKPMVQDLIELAHVETLPTHAAQGDVSGSRFLGIGRKAVQAAGRRAVRVGWQFLRRDLFGRHCRNKVAGAACGSKPVKRASRPPLSI